MSKVIWNASFAILLLASTFVAARSEELCSVGVLKGSYIFAGRGFIEAVEPTIQRVHYGVFIFDGAGRLSGKQSSSRGGKIGREKLEGTYTLDADCTGTLTFATVGYGKPGFETHWDLYVTEDHKRGHIVRMDEGNMAVRSFEK
jgi:hypothetical protein